MAVIPKRILGSLTNRYGAETGIFYIWVSDPGDPDAPLEQLEIHRMDLREVLDGIGDCEIRMFRMFILGNRHLVDVVAAGPWLVEVRPWCSTTHCRCAELDIGAPVRAAAELVMDRAHEVASEADRLLPGATFRKLPSFPEPFPDPDALPPELPRRRRRRRRGSMDPAPDIDHELDALDDGYFESDEEVLDFDPDVVDSDSALDLFGRVQSADADRALVSIDPWSGLEDLIDPPASWSHGHDTLLARLRAVARGDDLLADLCPDDDRWSLRAGARRLLDELDGLSMGDAPRRNHEREWIAERLRTTPVAWSPLTPRWASVAESLREAVVHAVETTSSLFDGITTSGTLWCEQAAALLDADADLVPASVRNRIEDPLELLTSAAQELARRCLAGEVPGTDVTGVDLWFAVAEPFAELAARGTIIGANERGDIPATGLVLVIGDAAARRSFFDAIELGIERQPTVRVTEHEVPGPHLAALTVARGARPVILNEPSGSSVFAEHASMRHIRVRMDGRRTDHDQVTKELEAIVDRWSALTPMDRDRWWEEQPRLYLPALIHALLLERGLPLPASVVLDNLDDNRIEQLIVVAARAGLLRIVDRLRALSGMSGSSTTGLSLRVTFSTPIPRDPVVRELELHPERLQTNAVLLQPGATAPVHAALDLAAAGAVVLWDSMGATCRAAEWLSRRSDRLDVVGFPNLSAMPLSMDVLRGATVVALPGCGDLTPLAGRSIDLSPGEAALVSEGTLTLIDPVDVLLRGVVDRARRDAFARQAVRIVRARLGV